MTAPPYEWPTSSTGPSTDSAARRTLSASVVTLRSGFGVAIAATPRPRRLASTPLQLDDSAKAPCTSTTVMGSGMILLSGSSVGTEEQAIDRLLDSTSSQ